MRDPSRTHQTKLNPRPFTDGLKSEQVVRWAAVLPTTNASETLPRRTSMFTAELIRCHQLYVSIVDQTLYRQNKIYSDSPSALQGLQNINNKEPLVERSDQLVCELL